MEIKKDNKLISLWQSLSPKEIRGLKSFLDSPYYNQRKDIIRLYQYLKQWQKLKNKPLLKSSVFAYVFPSEEFQDLKLRATMSDLFERIEGYLLDQNQQEKTIDQLLHLAKIYRERKLEKPYHWVKKKINRAIDHYPWRNDQLYNYQANYQIELMHYNSAKRRMGELKLQEIADDIDHVYLVRKLRHACTQLSHQAINPRSYDFGLLSYFIKYLPQTPYYKVPAVALYYHCYCFLSESYSIPHFQIFRELFYQHAKNFPPEERKDLYLFALNFCIRLHNSGQGEFTKEAWHLYQFALEDDLLMENQQLSRFSFNNIIGIGIKLGELDWVDQFIRDYQSFIPDQFQESSVCLNQARLAIARKTYSAALPWLQRVNREDLLNNLISRTLLIKIFYHTKADTSLVSQLDALEKLLRRKEVHAYHQRNFTNLIRFTRRLLSLAPYDKEGKKQLRTAIQDCPELSEKDWLLSILD